jgi:hypothetical protein
MHFSAEIRIEKLMVPSEIAPQELSNVHVSGFRQSKIFLGNFCVLPLVTEVLMS